MSEVGRDCCGIRPTQTYVGWRRRIRDERSIVQRHISRCAPREWGSRQSEFPHGNTGANATKALPVMNGRRNLL